jgi:surfeit locus 1 family protein
MSPDSFVLEGIIRLAQRQGQFVPDNEPARGFWFTMKPDEVAAHLGLEAAEQAYYIDAIRQEGEELTLPIAAEVKIEVRNSHLNYAITWYGIALSLIGVYFAYHHSQGRLRFGSARPDEDAQDEDKS